MASISQLKKLSLGIKWFAQGHTGREVWVLKFLNPCLVFFLSYIYYIYIFKLPLMPTMNFVDFCLVIFFLHTTLVIDHFKALTSQPSNSPWAQLFCSTLGWIGLRWASCRCVNKTSSTYSSWSFRNGQECRRKQHLLFRNVAVHVCWNSEKCPKQKCLRHPLLSDSVKRGTDADGVTKESYPHA